MSIIMTQVTHLETRGDVFFLSITHIHSRYTVRNRRTTLINVVRNTWSGYVQSVLRVIAWCLRCVHNPNIREVGEHKLQRYFNCRKKNVDITWPHFSKNESLSRRSHVEALLPLLRRLFFFLLLLLPLLLLLRIFGGLQLTFTGAHRHLRCRSM